MDLRVHGIAPAVLRKAKARADAAGETLSAVVRRLLARYADHGDSPRRSDDDDGGSDPNSTPSPHT